MDWNFIRKRTMGGLVAASLVAVGIMFALTWDDFYSNGSHTQDFFESLLCVPVFTVYILCHMLCRGKCGTGKVGKVVSALGGCVFGTYLLEGILRVELGFIYEALEPHIHVLPACLIWVLAVGTCGMIITWILRKIPVVRKLL